MMKRTFVFLALLCIFLLASLAAPVAAGLTIADGAKIITRTGDTIPEITITDSIIPIDGTITIDTTAINGIVASGTLTDVNVNVTSNAGNASWTGAVAGNVLTLTSTGGPTVVNEKVSVNFTGRQGSAWKCPLTNRTGVVTATRTDTLETATFNIVIETALGPGGLAAAPGKKITTTGGATSMLITITDAPILQFDTIGIDVWPLDAYVSGGTLSDANVVVTDTAAAATWTGAVQWGTLTLLTSHGGPTAVGETVNVTFTGAAGGNAAWIPDTGGNKTELLWVTRNDNGAKCNFTFMIETAPPPGFTVVANFSVSKTSDLAPVTIKFTDTSEGNPTSWSWDFGDGSTSVLRNPVHTYTNVGTYTVSLNATNAYGSDTKTQTDYINALNGAIREANTSINGLTITNCGGPQYVTVDTSILPSILTSNTHMLELQPPADRGFKNITLYAPGGFSRIGNKIVGNPTLVRMVSEEIAPSSGFSNSIGTHSSFSYSIKLRIYPCDAKIRTKIWEGVVSNDDTRFRQIAGGNNGSLAGTAYTLQIVKTHVPAADSVTLHVSVNASWKSLLPDNLGKVYVVRIPDDGTSGTVLNTSFLYHDAADNLDYFEADSPGGLSTFGITSLSTPNNLFQILTLVISSPPESPPPSSNAPPDSSSSTTVQGTGNTAPASVQNPAAPGVPLAPAPAPVDPGKTATVYANANGVVTQATTLHSTDGLATINLGLGVVAVDAAGTPLSSVSIAAVPAGSLPALPTGTTVSYAGLNYDLKPDGATFSPAISVSFTVPQGQWAQDYTIRSYDHATGTWQDLSTSYDAQTGTVTAQVSHLCLFALFTKTLPSPSPAGAQAPPAQVTVKPTPARPSPTIATTFLGIILWVGNLVIRNPTVFVGIVVLAVAIVLFGWKRRRDRLMFQP
jgi:PKD repeat protein